MSYQDTARALAQRAPGNYIGVALYVGMGEVPARWDAVALASLDALKEWYEEIAGAPTLYYYLAAFDKQQGSMPVGEAIAPPKPGDPGFSMTTTWRPPPFGSSRPAVSGYAVGAEPQERHHEPTWFPLALIGAALGAAYAASARTVSRLRHKHGSR